MVVAVASTGNTAENKRSEATALKHSTLKGRPCGEKNIQASICIFYLILKDLYFIYIIWHM